MKKEEVKTIDINCLEWFDKVNGNSYFAGSVTVNYGMEDVKIFDIPFQYGYGSQYEHEAKIILINEGLLDYTKSGIFPLSNWELKEKGIIVRSNIVRGCKKRDLK